MAVVRTMKSIFSLHSCMGAKHFKRDIPMGSVKIAHRPHRLSIFQIFNGSFHGLRVASVIGRSTLMYVLIVYSHVLLYKLLLDLMLS